jgi:hypothetical protein
MIKAFFITLLLLLIIMEMSLENKKKDISLELEILMNQAIIWKDKVDILYLKPNLEISQSISVMEDTTH